MLHQLRSDFQYWSGLRMERLMEVLVDLMRRQRVCLAPGIVRGPHLLRKLELLEPLPARKAQVTARRTALPTATKRWRRDQVSTSDSPRAVARKQLVYHFHAQDNVAADRALSWPIASIPRLAWLCCMAQTRYIETFKCWIEVWNVVALQAHARHWDSRSSAIASGFIINSRGTLAPSSMIGYGP